MSRLESSNPLVAIARGSVINIPRPGTNSPAVATPGLATLPPDDETVNTFLQIERSLGLATATANTLAGAANREASIQREERSEFEAAHRGAASLSAQTDIAAILDQIENQEIVLDGENADAYAKRIVSERVSGETRAWAEQYEKMVTPRIVAAFVAQERAMKDRALDELDTGMDAGARNAATTAELNGIIDDATTLFNITREEAIGRFGVAALEQAAIEGNEEKFRQAVEVIGDRFPAERAKAENSLRVNRERDQRQQNAEIQDGFYTLLYDDASPAELRGYIDRNRSAIGDQDAVRLRETIDRREQQQIDQAAKEKAAIDAAVFRSRTLDTATNAALTGGASLDFLRIEDATFVDSVGKEHTVSAKEQREHAIDTAMEYHAKTSPDPETALTRQISTLATTGETYPFWERTMRAGYTAGANAFLDENGPSEPPPAVRAGYTLFKRLNAQSPAIASKHTESDARAFYAIAELSEKYLGDGEDAALARAMRATRDGAMPTSLSQSIPRNDFEDAAKWAKDATNASEIRGDIEMMARLFMAHPGLDAKTATSEASKLVKASYTKSGDSFIYSANRNSPQNLDELAQFAGRDYADKFGEQEGIRKRDIALVPGPVEGTWVLANMRMPGRPLVERWKEFIFTTADFARLEDARLEARKRDIIAEQNRRNQQPGGTPPRRPDAVEDPFFDFNRGNQGFTNIAGPD